MKLGYARRRAAMLFLMLFVATLGITPTAVADEASPQFAVSASSGRPGLQVKISQVDPCPVVPSDTGQYIEATFTDSVGTVTSAGDYPLVDQDGSWIGALIVTLPWERIASFDPLVLTPDVAPGDGEFQVRCFTLSGGRQVTREYEPQPFTVVGTSPHMALSTDRAIPGDTVGISSSDPCPASTSSVHVVIGNGNVSLTYRTIVDPEAGTWQIDAEIPEFISNPMGGGVDTPLGKYRVAAWCSLQGAPTLSAHYRQELLELVAPPVRYGALGDSYSSGVGTFNYVNTQNSCLRSSDAYAPFVARELGLGEPLFAACSGAVTDDFYVTNPRNPNEPAQLSRLSDDMEVVTLTIGGNDLGFKDVVDTCVNRHDHAGWGCSDDKSLRRKVERQLAALAGERFGTIDGRPIHSLLEVYRSVHNKSPAAKIYVAGYPSLFGYKKEFYTKVKGAPSGAACFMPVVASIDYGDALWLNGRADALNKVIREQVRTAQREGIQITYVPPDLFAGHRLCDHSASWLNEIVTDSELSPQPESLHPNPEGYWLGYGLAFVAIIRQG